MSQMYLRNATSVATARGALRKRSAGFTVTGTRHRMNQDRFLVDDERGLYIVADGMGGCRGGERASHMAIDLLTHHPTLFGKEGADREEISHDLAQAFLYVNQEIHAAANMDPQLYGMGTTAVVAMIVGNRAFIAGLGDSRGYLLRDGDLHQYTVDHNLAQTLVTLGAISREEAREHQWRHMLWRFLGVGTLKEGPEVATLRVEPGDRIVLVTDGVIETLTDRDLAMILDMHADTSDASEALVRSAVSRGTRDDATAIVVDMEASPNGSRC